MTACPARRIIIALALLTSAGCLPDGVAWAPDGKALAFTEDRGSRLVWYDLAKKERRVLADDTGTMTAWPAVSPDGKMIALGRAARAEDKVTMEIVLHPIGEGEAKSSKEFPWLPKAAERRKLYPTALAWAPDGKRIVVFCEGKTGIYDIEKDTLLTLDNVVPVPLSNAPMRPDGQGFLALLIGGEKTEVALIGWDGKPMKIDLGEHGASGVECRWDKHIAQLTGRDGQLDLDTMKRMASFRAGKPELLPSEGELTALHTFPDSKVRVCVVDWMEKTTGRDVARQRIEIQLLAEKKREFIDRRTGGVLTLFPSPDRKQVAVRFRPEGSKTHTITVIDERGKVTHEIAVKE